jgi:tellurite resistance protein TerC
MFEASITGWAVTLAVIAALIALDLIVSGRRTHAVGMREAAAWSIFYVGIALAFGLVLALIAGSSVGTQYLAGYVVEKSLSVDNLFVFVIIMSSFAIPAEQQARLLLIGIVGALILRAIFIAAGAAMLEAFSFTYLLFGLALSVTAIQLFRHRDQDPSVEDNVVVAMARRRGLTPWVLALLAIATTDVLFALDSIPAVFGVTRHAYVVFVANAFALLGLRPLFFLVAGLLDRLVYLSSGLAVVLGFIGLKLMLHFAHLQNGAVPEISTGVSLAVIATVLVATAAASVLRLRREPTLRAHAGALRDADARHRRSAEASASGFHAPGKAAAAAPSPRPHAPAAPPARRRRGGDPQS